MSNNREKRIYQESVHLYMALQRNSIHKKKNCIRSVIKDRKNDLEVFKARLKVIGGEWRVHRTVNARDVEKARIWLLKHLIDEPKNASFADSAWRTALLQRKCKAEKKFMLDIDTKDADYMTGIHSRIRESKGNILEMHESPKGWHYITEKFDTRYVCELECVTLLRDGYYYVCSVGKGQ